MGKPTGNKIGKRIGIIGLGSIGITHVEALVQIGIESFISISTGRGKKTIPDALSNKIVFSHCLEDLNKVDAIIIANPTSMHIETIEKVLKFKKPIFVEKPISDTLKNLDSIYQELLDYPNKIQIGFCLRYHPIIKKVKEIIDSGYLGKIFYSKLEVGQYLPTWHPYADYREEYFSKKSLGGGAIRTLSHEIDLIQYFFGSPQLVKAYLDKVSHLDIDVDDNAILIFNNKGQKIKIEMDFLQMNPKRRGIIFGEQYNLEYDLINKTLEIYNTKGTLEKNIVVNCEKSMYIAQMDDFLNTISLEKYATVQESKELMEIINKSEKQ